MVEFNELCTEDKAIICKLMRYRCEGKWTSPDDFNGLSQDGLKYMEQELLASLKRMGVEDV
jgi:hypothetical protein